MKCETVRTTRITCSFLPSNAWRGGLFSAFVIGALIFAIGMGRFKRERSDAKDNGAFLGINNALASKRILHAQSRCTWWPHRGSSISTCNPYFATVSFPQGETQRILELHSPKT